MRPVLDQSRELSAWLVVVRDVSEREHAEAQRRALDVRLLEQQRVESLTLLAGGLAHDFRSLLQGIIGNAELAGVQLARTPELSAVHESLQAINHAAERASELVARMQDYAGRRPEARQPVDLSALTGEMVTLLQNSPARHARLLLELPSAPLIALGDPTQLRQILLNLVNNAAEAARDADMEGSIHIRLSSVPANAAELQTASFDGTRGAGAAPDGTFAVLDVVDTGPGIDPRALSRVFDPYFSTKASGRGLGLSAVLGIVRGHQGAIRIQSEIGQGTSVRVWIPGVTTT
jgi:signal transduction histidine kinase